MANSAPLPASREWRLRFWRLGMETAMITVCLLRVLAFIPLLSVQAAYAEGQSLPQLAQGAICAQDAMLCPDGSAVTRTGPHCEMAPCPPPKTDNRKSKAIPGAFSHEKASSCLPHAPNTPNREANHVAPNCAGAQ